jgi:Cdc6-like AAA superfamily ATPase
MSMKIPSLGSDWNMITTPESLKQFYRAIAEGKSRQSLLVMGPTSTGKTELAKQVFEFVFPDQGEGCYPRE